MYLKAVTLLLNSVLYLACLFLQYFYFSLLILYVSSQSAVGDSIFIPIFPCDIFVHAFINLKRIAFSHIEAI